MNEQQPPDDHLRRAKRTDLLRKQAIAMMELWSEFKSQHPDMDLDDDMTDEQEALWNEFSAEPIARIQAQLDELDKNLDT